MEGPNQQTKCEMRLSARASDIQANLGSSSVEGLGLMHVGIGMATEAGELLDAVKKRVFYGSDFGRLSGRRWSGR